MMFMNIATTFRINCLMRKRFSVKYTTMMINSFLRQHVDHQLIKLLMITLKLLTSHLCSTDTTTNNSTTITSRCKSKAICMFVRDAEGISRLAMGKYQVLHLILQWLMLIKINGTLITPIRPTVYHYHCRAE